MKTVVCAKPGILKWEEREMPKATRGFSLVRIKQIGICGTDLHAFKGVQPFFNYPRVLGHELAAEFVEGDAKGFSHEDLLTILPYRSCGNCFACKLGKSNCCSTLSVLGVHEDGGMCQYLSVPNELLVHTKGLSLDETALVEPLAIGAHAVSRAGIQPQDKVLVIGAGPIGIGLLHFLSASNNQVIIAETNGFRLHFCKTQFPNFQCVQAGADVLNDLHTLTNGTMPSVIFDATGNLQSINKSIGYLSHAGKYILVGLQQGDIQVNHPEFHKREATLMSSRNATYNDFITVIESIKNKQIKPQGMITNRILFDRIPDEFPALYSQGDTLIKAMIAT